MTISVVANEANSLDDAMAVMPLAFDPKYGEAWTRSQCAGVLSGPGADLLIARGVDDGRREHDGLVTPLGFALLRTILCESELMLIAVAPQARRRGIARRLVEGGMSSARARGATRFMLEVRADNPALSIYAAAGLVPVGRRRDYYRGNDGTQRDALTLAVDL